MTEHELVSHHERRRRAIEATFAEAVYDARRRARLQQLGREPIPTPSRRALEILDRIDGKPPVIDHE